jgi:hypothetical protein
MFRAWWRAKKLALGWVRADKWRTGLGRLTGHLTLGPLTVYFSNAMHWAVDITTPWGFLCVHPTVTMGGSTWPWYVFLSVDGTPGMRSWGMGPGISGDCVRREGSAR